MQNKNIPGNHLESNLKLKIKQLMNFHCNSIGFSLVDESLCFSAKTYQHWYFPTVKHLSL